MTWAPRGWSSGWQAAPTSAAVDITVQDNMTWTDGFQFANAVPAGFAGNYAPNGLAGGAYAPVFPAGGPYGSYGLTGATGNTGPWAPWFSNTGPFAWTLSGQYFRLDIKADREQSTSLITFFSNTGQIVIVSSTNRVIQMNVPETAWVGVLPPGDYVYELMMYDGSVPPVRTPLMHGRFRLVHGLSGG